MRGWRKIAKEEAGKKACADDEKERESITSSTLLHSLFLACVGSAPQQSLTALPRGMSFLPLCIPYCVFSPRGLLFCPEVGDNTLANFYQTT